MVEREVVFTDDQQQQQQQRTSSEVKQNAARVVKKSTAGNRKEADGNTTSQAKHSSNLITKQKWNTASVASLSGDQNQEFIRNKAQQNMMIGQQQVGSNHHQSSLLGTTSSKRSLHQKQSLQYQRIQKMQAVAADPEIMGSNSRAAGKKQKLQPPKVNNKTGKPQNMGVVVDSKMITYAMNQKRGSQPTMMDDHRVVGEDGFGSAIQPGSHSTKNQSNGHSTEQRQTEKMSGGGRNLLANKRSQHLLGQGYSSLSISSIESNQHSGAQKPHSDSVSKQLENNVAIADEQQKAYGSTAMDNQHLYHLSIEDQKKNEMSYAWRHVRDQDCELSDDNDEDHDEDQMICRSRNHYEGRVNSPKVNQIRGLTPQNRLMSSQKMDSDSVMLTAIQATTVGSKDQFNQDISLTRKVEPKRSVSVSAKKKADELQQPYNRRAQILKERKEELKQQARENSFLRSQKKTDSISRLYSRPMNGAKDVFNNDDCASMPNQQMFNSSISVSNTQQTQMYTAGPGGKYGRHQIGGSSMLGYDPLNSSSFDMNEQFISYSNKMIPQSQHGPDDHVVLIKHASQQPLPGNQQSCSQKPLNTEESSSGIERAKQIINEKFQKMVDWGQFTSPFQKYQQDPNQSMQQHYQQNTLRHVGVNTQRAINQAGEKQKTKRVIEHRNNPKARIDMDDLNHQQTFGMSVFTPPAATSHMKNFQLQVEEEEQRAIPFTEREAEGEIPHPKRSPGNKFPMRDNRHRQNAVQQNSNRVGSLKQRQMQLAMQKKTHQAVVQVRGSEMTLNPNNQHGVTVSGQSSAQQTKLQQHFKGTPDQSKLISKSGMMSGRHYQQSQHSHFGANPMTSEKSVKSLKEILSGARQSSRASQSSNHRGHHYHADVSQRAENKDVESGWQQQHQQNFKQHHVNSPQMAASVHLPSSSQVFGGANNNNSVLNSERKTHQEEYPCSAFFQNDENFEKPKPMAGMDAQSIIISRNDNSFMQSSPLKHSRAGIGHGRRHQQQSCTIDGLDSVIINKQDDSQSVNQSELQFTTNVLSAIKGSTQLNNNNNNNYAESCSDANKYVSQFYPPANIQGEETQELIEALIVAPHMSANQPRPNQGPRTPGSINQKQNTLIFAKSQCQSPTSISGIYGGFSQDLEQAKRSHQQIRKKRLQQSASSNHMSMLVSGSHRSQQMSLTARKNLTHQKRKSPHVPVRQIGLQSQKSAMGPGGLGGHYSNNMSPRFNVVEKQRETSAGRLSLVSMNLQNLEDDLPPDPMFQTNTISPRGAARGQEEHAHHYQDTLTDEPPLHKREQQPIQSYQSQQQLKQQLKMHKKQKNQAAVSRQQQSTNLLHSAAEGCYISSHGGERSPYGQETTINKTTTDAKRKNAVESRHEIIAVAPKANQLSSLVDNQPHCTQMSVLITSSDQHSHFSSSVHHHQQQNHQQQQNQQPRGSRPLQPDDRMARKAYHKAQPSLVELHNDTPRQEEDDDEELAGDKTENNNKSTVVRVEDDVTGNDSDEGRTESEKKRKRRENSFIRDGYEVYFEGTYIINGRRKKKIKKRKLSKQQLERHNRALEDKIRKAGGGNNKANIERELEAINDLRRQTQEMAAGKLQQRNIVTLKPSQVHMKNNPFDQSANQLSSIKLQKQTTSSQQNLAQSSQANNSPRLIVTKVKIPQMQHQTVTGIANPMSYEKSLQVKIPRKLFVKNNQAAASFQNLIGEEESKTAVTQQQQRDMNVRMLPQDNSVNTASTKSLNLRDPDLQLITSSRQLTLRDVSLQHFNSCKKFILQRMIFQKKFPELLKVFRSGFLTVEQLNEKDHLGNTPLLLAAKLSANEEEYLKCINFLFKQGCDGKIKDSNGWSIIDEAIIQANSRLMGIAFSWLNIVKKEKIQRNKVRVLSRLKQIPDFYCELHWECQSSWIPFLSKLAPSDDFQIWKVGSNIRLDFSLVGFKNLKNKRRRMTLLFRNAAEDEEDERYKDIDIIMVNRDREILTNPLEDLDEDEKLAVLTDIMNADPVQNELNIKRQEWHQVSNFFGNAHARETINGYDCSKFKLQIQAQVRSKKKVRECFEHTYESYFQGAEEFNHEENKVDLDPASFKMAKDVEKTVESQLWLAQDYPLQFEQFMEVLDTLAISGQASMQKIHEFLQNDCLKDVVSRNGFPAKIQVPIGMIVKAMVTFGNFEFLHPENPEEYIKETFAIPEYCKLVSRKEAMKTMQSKKKRLAVANVVI